MSAKLTVMKKLTISVLFVLILVGCNSDAVFREYVKFDNITWNRFDIIEIEVPVNRADDLDFYFALRHHTDFPYSFIDVNFTFYTPDGEVRSRDYHYLLKNTKLKWKGDGMGDLWDIELPIRKGISFKKNGICKVRIENKMNKAQTPGIIEIGLIVKKSEKD